MATRPKYQVFISSTYRDLHEERDAVAWRVLSARHIPVGMENFTASDERGWKTIQNRLDETDYYVLILAGLYGTVDDATGVSWTQREYEYAVANGIPVLAFIRRQAAITADKMEKSPDGAAKLRDLISAVRNKHLCSEWSTEEELCAHVVGALNNHIIDDQDAGTERPGWFRGDKIAGPEVASAMAKLVEENERLRGQLVQWTEGAPQLVLDYAGLFAQSEKHMPGVVLVLRNVGTRNARGLTIEVSVHAPGIDLLQPNNRTWTATGGVLYSDFEHLRKLHQHADGEVGVQRYWVDEVAAGMSLPFPLLYISVYGHPNPQTVLVQLQITDEQGRTWSLERELEQQLRDGP